jgi:hypothetical protein
MKYRKLIYGLAIALLFLAGYIFWLRPWMMRWGATDAELSMPLPGDGEIPADTVVSTRAITIHAPLEQVWPWLAQLGQEHGGFYSYDWLENLFAARMDNAETIVPEWQMPRLGDVVTLAQDGPVVPRIVYIEPGRGFVLTDGWGFYLQPIDAGSTRLVVRYASFPVTGLGSASYYYPIFEPMHFVMEAGMMMGIKRVAEQAQR